MQQENNAAQSLTFLLNDEDSEVPAQTLRLSLLQSLVEPIAKIAKGFESVTIVLQCGQLVAGVIRNEENGKITIEQPDGRLVTISADDVQDRTAPKSAMPEMHRARSARECKRSGGLFVDAAIADC